MLYFAAGDSECDHAVVSDEASTSGGDSEIVGVAGRRENLGDGFGGDRQTVLDLFGGETKDALDALWLGGFHGVKFVARVKVQMFD